SLESSNGSLPVPGGVDGSHRLLERLPPTNVAGRMPENCTARCVGSPAGISCRRSYLHLNEGRRMPVTPTRSHGPSWEGPDDPGGPRLAAAICPLCSEQVTLTPAQGTLACAPPTPPAAATIAGAPARPGESYHTLSDGRGTAAATHEQVPGYEVLHELGR